MHRLLIWNVIRWQQVPSGLTQYDTCYTRWRVKERERKWQCEKEKQHLDTFGNYAFSSPCPKLPLFWVRSNVCIYVLEIIVGYLCWAQAFVGRVLLGERISIGPQFFGWASPSFSGESLWLSTRGHNVLLLSCRFTCTCSGRVVIWEWLINRVDDSRMGMRAV